MKTKRPLVWTIGFIVAVVIALAVMLIICPNTLSTPVQAAVANPQQTWRFTGNVYDGLPPSTSTALSGVTVTLYGSNNAG